MMDLWDNIVPSDGTFDPYLFESYCRMILREGPFTLNVKNFQEKDSQEIEIGGHMDEVTVDDIVAAAIETENTIYIPGSKTNKFIDFMYREGTTYNMFQATISKQHSCNPTHLYDIVKSIERNIQSDTLPSFNIYYMVPGFKYDKFSITPVDSKLKARNLLKKKNNHLFYMRNGMILFLLKYEVYYLQSNCKVSVNQNNHVSKNI
jgi:hypothetical protein